VLIGPGPMQTETGIIEVVVVVKGKEGNDGEKVGVRVGEHFVQPACRPRFASSGRCYGMALASYIIRT